MWMTLDSTWLVKLVLNAIYNNGEIPEDISRSTLVELSKKNISSITTSAPTTTTTLRTQSYIEANLRVRIAMGDLHFVNKCQPWDVG